MRAPVHDRPRVECAQMCSMNVVPASSRKECFLDVYDFNVIESTRSPKLRKFGSGAKIFSNF
jgi:hypothetical protein